MKKSPAFLSILLQVLLFLKAESQIISTIAGGGVSSNNNIPALNANILSPNTIIFDNAGNYYLACPISHKVMMVNVSDTIKTVVGTGVGGYNGDGGLADTTKLQTPFAATTDSIGNIFIADAENHRVRKIDKATGIISTVAGTGTQGYGGDGGLATSALLYHPNYVHFDKAGNLYISDYNNSRIRKINHLGIISTVIGTGVYGYDGDGSQATSAKIGGPRSVITDSAENLYVADMDYNCVRKVNVSTGIITTIAGTGFSGYIYNGDNIPATTANVKAHILALDKSHNLYISDPHNNRIRKIDFSTGLMTTVAGDGTMAHAGDGDIATLAQLNRPSGITFDTCGNLYITQVNDGRIRKVSFNPNCWPVSVAEIKPLSFNIYPNPANTELVITANNRLREISISNAVGQLVHQQNAQKEKTVIDIAHLQAGIYFVTVTDGNGGRLTKKIVKQ